MNAWLITGGAGFIGSNFVRVASHRKDIHLIVLDALTYAGNLANISDVLSLPHVHFKKGNICDAMLIEELFKEFGITHVVHLAAESHVDRSILGAHSFIKTNIEGTFTLLETARKYWKNNEQNRFLHVSTDEVYGSLAPDEEPFCETTPYCPNSPYSASKAGSDHLVRAWHHTYNLPTIISNCSNNYGPWQFPEKLIPLTILNAIEGREIPVYGDGSQVRDWLHVEEHCSALIKILERGKPGETYLIGANNEKTNLEVVKTICTIVDKLAAREEGTSHRLITFVKDRPGHDRRYAINSEKLRRELGWKPRFIFKDSLADVVQWYLDHEKWTDFVRRDEYRSYYEKQYVSR